MPTLDASANGVLDFVGRLCSYLVSVKDFNTQHWSEALTPYLEVVCPSLESAEEVSNQLCEACKHLGHT
jgi:hypothetical protein